MSAVISRLAGASVRAALVAVAVVVPALSLPDVSNNSAELAILSAAIAAAFVIIEYGFKTPTLVEFRFAAPYNRFRFAILAALLVALTVIFQTTIHSTGASVVVSEFGRVAFSFWNFPGSPMSFFLILAQDMGAEGRVLIGTAAAIALTIASAGVALFTLSITLFAWPLSRDTFNLWMNMPTFDANDGDQTQASLRQSAFMSVLIGASLPYLAPQAALAFMGPLGSVTTGNSLFLVWMIAIWCFVPAVSLLRAVALYKVAHLLSLEDVPQG